MKKGIVGTLALGGVIIAIGLILWVFAAPASAQLIQPNDSHYARAGDGLALERARRNLLEAERRVQRAYEAMARFRVLEDEVLDAQLRFLDAHAAEVQRWAGLPRQSIRPGRGWHR